MLARLVGDFYMDLGQIARLTDRQIADLYGHPRDDEGRVVTRDEHSAGGSRGAVDVSRFGELPDTPENQKAALFAVGGMLRIPAAELERVWAEKQAKAGVGDAAG